MSEWHCGSVTGDVSGWIFAEAFRLDSVITAVSDIVLLSHSCLVDTKSTPSINVWIALPRDHTHLLVSNTHSCVWAGCHMLDLITTISWLLFVCVSFDNLRSVIVSDYLDCYTHLNRSQGYDQLMSLI